MARDRRTRPREEELLFSDLWEKTDGFLVEQCLAGNGRAWSCLVRRYKKLVYHFPSKAGLGSEDCDDVFQETFIAFYKQIHRIEQVENLSYWLAKVSQRNTWKAVNQNTKYAALGETYDVLDPDHIPEKNLVLKVRQFQIRRGLMSLGARCRRLLTMLFYESGDNDYKRISEELGIAMGSIGPTRNRCLVKFKKVLSNLGIDEKNVSKWLR